MKILPWLIPLLGFMSCASHYNPVRPSSQRYQSQATVEGVIFSYKHGVLAELKNRKYSKREDKNDLRLIAIEIENTTTTDLKIGREIIFRSGERELRLVEPDEIHRVLKQGVPIYLLYLLLTPMTISTSTANGGSNVFPIGFLLGPGITLGNMLSAGSSNNYFRHELEEYNLIGKSIPPGIKLHGLIGVYNNGYNPIQVEVRSGK